MSIRRLVLVTSLLAGAAGLSGCVGYVTYPAIGEGQTAKGDVNSPVVNELTIKSVRWATENRPVEGPYALNLPKGVMRKRTLQILDRLDDDDARMLTPETESLPTYHIARVWVRGGDAEVDVLCPVTHLRSPDGGPIHQAVTLRFRGGARDWNIVSNRAWTIGAVETPAPYYTPADDEGHLGPGNTDDGRYRSARGE